MPGIFKWLVFFSLFVSLNSFAQLSTQRQKSVAANTTSIALDTFSIYPGSISCKCGDQLLPESAYTVDFAAAAITLKTPCPEELTVNYRILPVRFSYTESRRDTSLIYNSTKGDREKFLIEPASNALDLLGTGGLQKPGSISRGISFGNRQDLSVNSSLNLELSGYVTPNLQVLASVTDDNLPIQPEGNTNKLQEFDQVFIQLFNDRFKLTAGDFWISKPEGYFMTYKKRGQGLTGEYYWIKDKNRSAARCRKENLTVKSSRELKGIKVRTGCVEMKMNRLSWCFQERNAFTSTENCLPAGRNTIM